MSGPVPFCTFRLGELFLGIEVDTVQEVLRSAPITPVPRAPQCVRGLVNLRGRIVTAIDLGVRLGAPPAGAGREPMHVVVRGDPDPSSLLVDRIGDVIDVPPDRVEPPLDRLPAPLGAMIRGVHPMPDELLLLLDLTRVVSIETGNRVRGDALARAAESPQRSE